jgi:putative acetyltransferase
VTHEIVIRDERQADWKMVRRIHRLAFGGEAEGRLVERLRADGEAVVSLVAEYAGQVAGHVMYSRLPIERRGETLRGVALAPVAVRPELQRRGIGSRLIEAGNRRCQELGYDAILVLGSPSYYPRFGFTVEAAQGLVSRYAGPYFMGLELVPGSLRHGGEVRYPRAFELVE